MNRRTVLASLALSLGGGAAALYTHPSVVGLPTPHDQTFSPDTGPHIRNYQFQLTSPEESSRHDEFSSVSFEPPNRVHITGNIASGGDDCHDIDLKTLAYDADARTLTVEVFNDTTNTWGEGCVAVQSFRPYELTVDFTETFPTSVVVEHINDPHIEAYRQSFTHA